MTREEILKMEEGLYIDTFVAEKIMGWHKGTLNDIAGSSFYADKPCWRDGTDQYAAAIYEWEYHGTQNECWSPSTEIKDVWEVVEKMFLLGFNTRIEVQSEIRVTIWSKRMTEHGPEPTHTKGKTVPSAFCRAALLAVLG